MVQKNILLILTGGTICSFSNSNGEQSADTQKAQTVIVENFRKSTSVYSSEDCVAFNPISPLNILSENMNINTWNTLINSLKKQNFSSCDGVIILHGTDTLAYTASLLSLLLAGITVPVIMVSSQLAPYNPDANGNANFKAAVELICNGIKPNIYAVYRNEENDKSKTMYVHYASHLLQCANHSNNFYSADMTPISSDNAVFEGKKSPTTSMLLNDERFSNLCAKVLKIQPYVGLDYNSFSLKGVDAIVHGTYHSTTAATIDNPQSADYNNSIIYLKKELCDKQNPPIPVFMEPYLQTTYETTGDALRCGILPIKGLTSEMAYVKVLVGCSMELRDKALYDFIDTNINNEFLSN